MIKLSVVIITFNEGKNIGRCIDSVLCLADDIIIVDSFSNDRTEEIATSKGARFVKQKFLGHIEQKNFAITQAKYPHILSLDADESLSEKLQKSILKVKENWQGDGYKMNRMTNYCGKWIKHCGWYPDTKLRLWDSRKGKWEGINPHDKYIMEKQAKIIFLEGDIFHYSYYSILDHLKQTDKFTDISARELLLKGKKPNYIKLIFSPIIKFLRDYFFNLGFLDGYYGFIICKISANATFLKYKKLKNLYSEQKNNK